LLRGAAEGDDPEVLGAGLAAELVQAAGGLLEEWGR
jgi:hypothetical protein